jgi:hypothetical protein
MLRGKYKTKFSIINFEKLKKYIKKLKNGKLQTNGKDRLRNDTGRL